MEIQSIDISDISKKQLTPALKDATDRVVVMTERVTWPDVLANSDNVTIWNLSDPEVLDQIGRPVEALVCQIG